MGIRDDDSGLFSVALRPCTAAVLAHVLPASDVTVWIRGYRPQTLVCWWRTSIQLRSDGPMVECAVRDLEVDLQFPVQTFRAILAEFEGHGLDLVLMDRPVPPTLTLRGLDHSASTRVLMTNGFLARFDLPHAHETAVLAVRSREMLEGWLTGPLKDWIL